MERLTPVDAGFTPEQGWNDGKNGGFMGLTQDFLGDLPSDKLTVCELENHHCS